MSGQFDLFGGEPPASPARLPDGFFYQRDLVAPADEAALVEAFATLPFREFEFRGYTGKRRVVSFGWRYDFATERLRTADDIPAFLHPVRALAATFAGLAAEALQHALVTEYGPGAGIGWHRDKDVFGDVVGVSLLAPCLFRLRRRVGEGWERVNVPVDARSVYLLRGPSRTVWEHSIPPVDAVRYSITFRSMREPGRDR